MNDDKITRDRNVNEKCDTSMTIKINSEFLERFKEECLEQRISYGTIVKRLMKQYLEQRNNKGARIVVEEFTGFGNESNREVAED